MIFLSPECVQFIPYHEWYTHAKIVGVADRVKVTKRVSLPMCYEYGTLGDRNFVTSS